MVFVSASGHLDKPLIGPFRVPHGACQATMTPSWAVPRTCCHVTVLRHRSSSPANAQEPNHRDIRRGWGLQSGCHGTLITHAGPASSFSSPYLSFSVVSGLIRLGCDKGHDLLSDKIRDMARYMPILFSVPNATGTLGGLGSHRLGPDATVQLHTCTSLLRMHDGTDDDASPGIWPAMRRSPGQTMMASSPGPPPPQGLCPGLGQTWGPCPPLGNWILFTTSLFFLG